MNKFSRFIRRLTFPWKIGIDNGNIFIGKNGIFLKNGDEAIYYRLVLDHSSPE